MAELPSGTVSLLFSDIEGSTALLSRLGAAYVDALDSHRAVLRKAWIAHGGIELNTEGDSFFVVFPTAESAVHAAAEAQQGLASHPWPDGERVRVRIGVHTGSPQVHDGDYVGMDVHLAARIASSAHGGQVVVSAVTAELARASLSEGVGIRDLGSHRLKDITAEVRLFQLVVDGLPTDFPPLRVVGATSRLPMQATRLVGRDHELARLTTLVRSPDVRLVTLTGPGGSGKSRLAVAAAGQLVDAFPDGVFFVPLASVHTADVMWTSIAEVMDAPPQARVPPALLHYAAHLTALLILDNLEQLDEADVVVAQLLAATPNIAVIASSRRALSLPAEHRQPVPPLALPQSLSLETAEESSAVQLFVQQARSVSPSFSLTTDNVGDVVAICRRLDGLPLALELAAARIRLLSPKALLRRLDQALDIASTSSRGPGRQRTLRETIAWSYELLSSAQQAFFRRLGVFSGGADLDALAQVTAVSTAAMTTDDALGTVADLVDASVVTIAEGPDREPRVAMLETIRDYARDRLVAAGEADAVQSAHARHYLGVAENLALLREKQHLLARDLAEVELDNFREALDWSLRLDGVATSTTDRTLMGLRLCLALNFLWLRSGHLIEGRRWYEKVIARAGDSSSPELAACLAQYANLYLHRGEHERVHDVAVRSLDMARSLGDAEVEAVALGILGTAYQQSGDVNAALETFEEALELHRRSGNRNRLANALGNLAGSEETLGHFGRAEELTREAVALLDDLGDVYEATGQRQNLANLLAVAGRIREANELAKTLVPTVLKLRSPNMTSAFANTCMHILIRLGEPAWAAHLFGAEEAMRERNAMPNPYQQEELEEMLALVEGMISLDDWNHHRELGRSESLEDLLARFGGLNL